MSEPAPADDPIQTVSMAIRRSGWKKILAIAKAEGLERNPRRQAGILLERLLEDMTVAA